VHTITSTLALALFAPAPAGPTPPATPDTVPRGDRAAADAQPAPSDPEADTFDPEADTYEPLERPSIMLDEDYEPPFPSEPMALSQVLEESAGANFDLALFSEDIKIAEATVLQAVGAFDWFLVAGLNGSMSETPQRGSQFVFALAQRTLVGNVGFTRRLETGGEIRFDLSAGRTRTLQPVNFFDADAGSIWLSEFRIAPTLTVTHPLLRGAGLKVNRADINRAKIATSQAEAARLGSAQDLARDVISAYWDVLFAHRDLENRRRSVELATRQLERTQALVAAGRLSPVDAKTVEQGLAQRESEVLTSENTLLDTSLTLRTLMGQEFADRDVLGILPATDPIVRPREVVVRDEIERAMQINPQVRQLELAIASRRIDELVAANQRLPQLDANASFIPQGRSINFRPDPSTGDPGQAASWGEAFRNFFGDDIRQDGFLADWQLIGGLTLTWDIQNRGPRGAHERAKAELRVAETQLKQIRQTVAAGVIRSANGLRITGKQIAVSELSLELALENLEAEQARFEVGRATSFNVLERLDEVDLAAATALSAQVQYLKTLVQLQALTGEILPAYGLAP
jgi:outer membrane protein